MNNQTSEPTLEELKKSLKETEEAIDTLYKINKMLIPIAETQNQYGRFVLLNILTNCGGEIQFLEVRSLALRKMIDDRSGGILEPV